MSWVRIDDGFVENHKISELSDREFRTWVRTLCYASRNNGRKGRLTAAMRREVLGLTPALVDKLVDLGLLDRTSENGTVQVHDWPLYADLPITEKVAYYLSRNPSASANEVAKAVGGKREIILAEVARFRGDTEEAA